MSKLYYCFISLHGCIIICMHNVYCVEEELKIKHAFEANGYPTCVMKRSLKCTEKKRKPASQVSEEVETEGKKDYSYLML